LDADLRPPFRLHRNYTVQVFGKGKQHASRKVRVLYVANYHVQTFGTE